MWHESSGILKAMAIEDVAPLHDYYYNINDDAGTSIFKGDKLHVTLIQDDKIFFEEKLSPYPLKSFRLYREVSTIFPMDMIHLKKEDYVTYWTVAGNKEMNYD